MIPKAELKLPNESGIYMITCTANGKFYIGSTKTLQGRWSAHRRALRADKHDNRYLQNAWNKYGEEAFKFAVLEKCECDVLEEREDWYIETWEAVKIGFNMVPKAGRPPSSKGRKHTPETIAKMTGRKHAPETIAKMTARKHTPETIAKISAACKGLKRSPETRVKMSEAKKGRKHAPEHVAKAREANCRYTYIVSDPSCNEIVSPSLRMFCRDNALDMNAMYRVANGKARHHKGWKVRRIDANGTLLMNIDSQDRSVGAIHVNGILPQMSKKQIEVLVYLYEKKKNHWTCAYLDDWPKRIINLLLKRQWIFCSQGNCLDQERYGITNKGLRAIDVYSRRNAIEGGVVR